VPEARGSDEKDVPVFGMAAKKCLRALERFVIPTLLFEGPEPFGAGLS
jgi:hypothetical protein